MTKLSTKLSVHIAAMLCFSSSFLAQQPTSKSALADQTRRYDSFLAVQEQSDQAPRLASNYRELKKGCRLIADGLLKALQSGTNLSVLKRGRSQLESCYDQVKTTRRLLEPFMYNVYALARSQTDLGKDGWTADQLSEAPRFVKRWDEILERIDKADREIITDSRIERILEKAEDKISPKLKASISPMLALLITKNSPLGRVL